MVLKSTGFVVSDGSGNVTTTWRGCIYDMFPSQYSSLAALWPLYRILSLSWKYNTNTVGLAKGDMAVEIIHATTGDVTPSTSIAQMGREPSSINSNISLDTTIYYKPIQPRERDFYPCNTTTAAPFYINMRIEGALASITVGNVVIAAYVELAHAM